MRKYVAEAVGTFGIVFAGTGAIIVNDLSNGTITHVGISLTFGLIVACMIYALGSISGAHFNPAVTIALTLFRKHDRFEAIPFIASQIAGALFASILLKVLFPEHLTLGMTLPAGSASQAFLLEIVLTFFLMLVIAGFVASENTHKEIHAFAIGGVVCLDALLGGPITGASMNPARSLGPALVALNFQHQWLYVIAPILGALLAAALQFTLFTSHKKGVEDRLIPHPLRHPFSAK